MRLDGCEHIEPCGNDYVCRLRSVTFGSMSGRAYEVKMKDRQFEKDAAAYRRLRKNGVQPKHIDGSALAETLATHKAEIEIGRDLHPIEKKALTRLNSAAL